MTISSMYNVDAGLKWISPNGKAEISLKVDDMFNSWVPKDLNLQYKTQDLHMRMIPDSRRVSLSFIYKFGDFKAKEHKEVDRFPIREIKVDGLYYAFNLYSDGVTLNFRLKAVQKCA